jgi:hypothetical protein
MSAETDYLAQWFAIPYTHGMTFTTMQRTGAAPGPQARWSPGITGFGWSNYGGRTRLPDGTVTALVFQAYAWFSDRVVNRGVTPTQWQQFNAAARDEQRMTFSINGDHVRLRVVLVTWGNATWDADSFAFDVPSQQLLFRVPGAGAGAPPALMATSFGPGAPYL